jgi:hypothetical protein
MTIADVRPFFHWIVNHWRAWGITGVLIGLWKVVPMALARLYTEILVRYQEAKEQLVTQARTHTAATIIQVPEEAIIGKTKIPRWLVLRALRWDKKRKLTSSV